MQGHHSAEAHLTPFRTQKLSSVAPKILTGKIGSGPILIFLSTLPEKVVFLFSFLEYFRAEHQDTRGLSDYFSLKYEGFWL